MNYSDPDLGKRLVSIARSSIESHLDNKDSPPLQTILPDEPYEGIFVTLWDAKKDLRGCIGFIHHEEGELAKNLERIAISAAVDDHRFQPVSREELNSLKVEVSILHSKTRISDKSELDPQRFGVSVRSGFKHGVLLPDIDGVDTVDQQLAIAMKKGGISPAESIEVDKFQVTKFKEDDQ